MTKTWNVDRLLPEAETTYRRIEQQFGIQVYHPVPLRRYCQHSADAKRLGRRMRNPRYHDVFGNFIPPGSEPEAILDTHGSVEILHAAYVDLPKLVLTLRNYFAETGRFRDETFAHSELTQQAHRWHYHGIDTDKVIFCEGIGMRENPWFRSLPLTPAKGETLILTSETLQLPQTIYHHKKWILPYGDQSFRVGATYDEADLTPEPTPHGKAELFDAAREFIKPEHALAVQQHLAGIRPSTSDTRPLLGRHPEHPELFILNGLGSKGASLAPEMSRAMLDFLISETPLDPEVDIARFQTPLESLNE